MATSARTVLAERFKQLERNFNESAMQMLHQLRSMFEEDADGQGRDMFVILDQNYELWFKHFVEAPQSAALCDAFYAAVGDNYRLLLEKKEEFFTDGGRDFFEHAFQAKG